MTSDVPSTVLRAAALLKKKPVSWQRPNGGYTPADRYVVQFADGTSAFAKAGTTPLTAMWLRDEYAHAYARLKAPFLARILGWEDGELPLLVLEDLSGAAWPPPWTESRVQAVVETMRVVRSTVVDPLPQLEDVIGKENWLEVGVDPGPFLSLGLSSAAWLDVALPMLVAASQAAPLAGTDLVHLDLRSDNICFVGDRTVIVDWNHGCHGNGDLDLAGWLPSLHSEGGPEPETILPKSPELAAYMSGYFAQRAGLPQIPNAPRVRQVQLSQLKSALPWAQRAVGLPPLDGPKA